MKKGLKVIAILLIIVFALPLVSACGPKPSPEPEVAKITNYDLQLTEDESGYILTRYKDDTKLKKVEVPGSHEGKPVVEIGASLFRSVTNLEEVVLPSTVTKVGSSAFSGLKKLKTINTENIADFGVSAFENCEGLTTINIEKATKLGASVFKNCKYLSEITIPSTCTEIPNSAFTSCIRLAKVNLPATLKTIDKEAFASCMSLADIDLSKVTSIGDRAFSNCNALVNVSMDEVVFIDNHAFDSCAKLKTVYIGKKIDVIYYNLFYNCTNLESVEVETPDTPWIYVYYPANGPRIPMLACWRGYDAFDDPIYNAKSIFLQTGWAGTLDLSYVAHENFILTEKAEVTSKELAHLEANKCKNCGLCIDRHGYVPWQNSGCGNPTHIK